MPATVGVKPFDRQWLAQLADWLAVGVAVSIPWSTSATGILIALWLLAVLPTLEPGLVWRTAKTPAGGLPVLLWLFAALGMLWADVTWRERFGGLDGFDKLLMLPLLLAQFRRSERGAFVVNGFLVSATCLLLTSWLYAEIPALGAHGKFYGVPVKDYIIQSDEFLLCAFALFGAACEYWRRDTKRAVVLFILAALFLGNLAFVITSRTNLVVVPFLVVALGWRLSNLKGVLLACLIGAVIAPLLWFSSSNLRDFVGHGVEELHAYFATDEATSAGLHVEFLKKSSGIVEEAPLLGHGTGSINEQFRSATTGESGAAGVVSDNPHNQIFAVAIQLGIVGTVMLLAMWVAHFMLFRGGGLAAWVGMVVVIQDVVSSVAHSHLFDFGQGWLYVFGVGVAGGMVLRQSDAAPSGTGA
jgi:O-antigen ligase